MLPSSKYTWMQMDNSSDAPSTTPSAAAASAQTQKKPRNRHSPAAIAALNQLYDTDEHPPLEQRTSLAKKLGMEVKTVNAWFQNKRASTKKQRSRAPQQQPSSHHSLPSSRYDDDYEDDDDDEYPSDGPSPHFNSSSHPSEATFYAGNPDHSHFLLGPDMPRKMRNRPSAEQTEQLRILYNQNPHPSTEQRQQLAQRIAMPYQTITNWFQNQRSLAKKRKEDDADIPTDPSNNRSHRPEPTRTFSAFPPPHLPPPSSHPSLGLPTSASAPIRLRRSPSVTPSLGDDPSPPKRSKRSSTPYSTNAHNSSLPLSRPRRTRPEPYQLHALKELSAKTINPSIEARTALASEIGMDLGKVTNWFRNLRQTTRKRASKKAGSGDEYDDGDAESYIALSLPSASVSRSGSPFIPSSSSSSHDDSVMLEPHHHHHRSSRRLRTVRREPSDYDEMSMNGEGDQDHVMESRPVSDVDDAASDEDYQEEAVTPSPDPSPSPPSPGDLPMPMQMQMQMSSSQKHGHHHHRTHAHFRMVIDQPYGTKSEEHEHPSQEMMEDALLLLTFHRHAVH